MTTVASIWLVLILGAAASLKAWRADRAAAALATYGIASGRGQRVTVWALISVEFALASALAVGVPWAAGAIAGLCLAFTVLTLAALLAGRKGRPCACFGSASRLGWSSPSRAAALAAVAGVMALGWLPQAPSGYDQWLTVGLSVSVAAVAALAVAVLALAREVGGVRLGAGGPAAVHRPPRALLRLPIFASEGCPLCRQVEPAVQHVAADPLLAVRLFDEAADSATWRQAEVPGSPYAVALNLEGVVLAKGTFNSLGQLESILGTARVREKELPVAA